MKAAHLLLLLFLPLLSLAQDTTVIRINQLGYLPEGGKVAVLGRVSKGREARSEKEEPD